MSRQHHYLKTVNPYFLELESGRKTFEVRFNDRNFKVFDILHLQEFSPPDDFSGREIEVEVTYVLDSPDFCKDGFVILGLGKLIKHY